MKITTRSRDEHKHAFFCPGCGFAHWFKTHGGGWTWNGDRERPTISPSVLAWADAFRCHSFVTDGRIRFLDDCTHKLRGQTVDLPEFDGPSEYCFAGWRRCGWAEAEQYRSRILTGSIGLEGTWDDWAEGRPEKTAMNRQYQYRRRDHGA